MFLADYHKLATVAVGTNLEEVFEKALSTSFNFRLTSVDLLKLKNAREKEFQTKDDRKMKQMGLSNDLSQLSSASKSQSNTVSINDTRKQTSKGTNDDGPKVDVEYLHTLMPYLKHYNAACALCVRTRYFGQNKTRSNGLLLKCLLKCGGKKCPFSCAVHVLNDGSCTVTSFSPNIFHSADERISRPIRGSKRRAIKDKFEAGASVYRLHAQYSQQRTSNEKVGFNYDSTGKTKAVFKKIKAETVAETHLAPDVHTGMCRELKSVIVFYETKGNLHSRAIARIIELEKTRSENYLGMMICKLIVDQIYPVIQLP